MECPLFLETLHFLLLLFIGIEWYSICPLSFFVLYVLRKQTILRATIAPAIKMPMITITLKTVMIRFLSFFSRERNASLNLENLSRKVEFWGTQSFMDDSILTWINLSNLARVASCFAWSTLSLYWMILLKYMAW